MDLQSSYYQWEQRSKSKWQYMHAPEAIRNLLDFKDIRKNNFHIYTDVDNNKEVLQILAKTTKDTEVRKTLIALSPGLYATRIVSFHAIVQSNSIAELWHRRLDHPGTNMFYKIIKDTQGISATVHPKSLKDPCLACFKGKLVTCHH
jgi:hypothetical protein